MEPCYLSSTPKEFSPKQPSIISADQEMFPHYDRTATSIITDSRRFQENKTIKGIVFSEKAERVSHGETTLELCSGLLFFTNKRSIVVSLT